MQVKKKKRLIETLFFFFKLGSNGYMFSVEPFEDAFVARFVARLELPAYVASIPDLLDTLDALYVWKNHQCAMKDILLPAIAKKESQKLFSRLLHADHPTDPYISPNVLYTPTKRRRSNTSHDDDPSSKPFKVDEISGDEEENEDVV